MSVHSPSCPNCGHTLVVYRTDRSWTVKHQLEAQWFTCPLCGHMSIQHWSVVDTVGTPFPEEDRSLELVLASM